MSDSHSPPRRKRGRGLRPWLLLLKHLGLLGFLGGLAALTALGLGLDAPADREGWIQVREVMRSIFWPCVFTGLLIALAAGIALFAHHPRVFLAQRWFRVKALLLIVFLPGTHLWGAGRVIRFYEAVDAGRLEELPDMHADVTTAFGVTLVIMLCVAAIGRTKPRLRQPFGRGPHPPSLRSAPSPCKHGEGSVTARLNAERLRSRDG